MRINLQTFTSSKVEEGSQGFIDEMKKIFRVMRASDSENVEFAAYQLKEVDY